MNREDLLCAFFAHKLNFKEIKKIKTKCILLREEAKEQKHFHRNATPHRKVKKEKKLAKQNIIYSRVNKIYEYKKHIERNQTNLLNSCFLNQKIEKKLFYSWLYSEIDSKCLLDKYLT